MTILKWIFGISFILSGIIGLYTNAFFGVLTIFIGLLVVPSSLKVIENKINFTFPSGLKWAAAVSGFVLMALVFNSGQQKEVEIFVEDAVNQIDKGNLDSALNIIKRVKNRYPGNADKAINLEKEIENSRSEDFAKEILAKMTDEEFTQFQKGELKKPYIKNQKTLNKDFYILLDKLAPQRKAFIEEIKIREEKAQIEESKIRRKELVSKQFSVYDGSHRGLTNYIKERMNDPDSYEHVETRFRDDGENIFVITKFRGKNAFGGKVLNEISARVDLNGNVIEIID